MGGCAMRSGRNFMECVDKGQGLEEESVIVEVDTLAKWRAEIGAVEYKEAMRV